MRSARGALKYLGLVIVILAALGYGVAWHFLKAKPYPGPIARSSHQGLYCTTPCPSSDDVRFAHPRQSVENTLSSGSLHQTPSAAQPEAVRDEIGEKTGLDGEFEGRTERPVPDLFVTTPDLSTYEERRQAYLERCASLESDDYWFGLAALELGRKGISDASLDEAIERLKAREDGADGTAAKLVRFLCGYRDHPLVAPAQWERVGEALKRFKYWRGEGGEDSMIMETENHLIRFNASEYLGGQTFLDDVFESDGKTGQWHREHARGLLLDWMNRKVEMGFAEWDSNCYLDKTIGGVANLAEFAAEEEIRQMATMMLDLILFDMALDLHQGVYGTSHGRAKSRDVLGGRDDAMRMVVWLVWGLGNRKAERGQFSGLSLATSKSYVPPEAIVRAGFLVNDNYTFPPATITLPR